MRDYRPAVRRARRRKRKVTRWVLRSVVVGLALLLFLVWMMLGPGGEEVGRQLKRLDSRDAQERLQAADWLIRHRQGGGEVLLARARALSDLYRYQEAREAIAPLLRDADDARMRRHALRQAFESYLGEAREVLRGLSEGMIDAGREQIEQLLAEATAAMKLMRPPGSLTDAPTDESRLIEVRTELLRRELLSLRRRVARVGALGIEEQMLTLGGRTKELEQTLAEQDARLTELCLRAEAKAGDGPEATMPRLLLFEARLRAGKVDEARAVAGRLSAMPALDREAAGRAASGLLQMELKIAQEVTPADVELAQGLLSHPALTGPSTADFLVGRAELALYQGRWSEAETQAQRALEEYPGHAVAVCVLARSLAATGRTDQAVKLLLLLLERSPSGRAWYTLGMVQLAEGDTGRGRDSLRQALDLEPVMLSAHLALAESFARAGSVADVANQTREAISLNPSHPAVIWLRGWVAVHHGGSESVEGLLAEADGDRAVSARCAMLTGRMLLDDPAGVRAMLGLMSLPTGFGKSDGSGGAVTWSERPWDPASDSARPDALSLRVGAVASGWLDALGEMRGEVAAVAVRSLLERSQGGGMDWPDAPLIHRAPPLDAPWLRRPDADDVPAPIGGGGEGDAVPPLPSAAGPAMHGRFVAWPHEMARELLRSIPGEVTDADGPMRASMIAEMSLWATAGRGRASLLPGDETGRPDWSPCSRQLAAVLTAARDDRPDDAAGGLSLMAREHAGTLLPALAGMLTAAAEVGPIVSQATNLTTPPTGPDAEIREVSAAAAAAEIGEGDPASTAPPPAPAGPAIEPGWLKAITAEDPSAGALVAAWLEVAQVRPGPACDRIEAVLARRGLASAWRRVGTEVRVRAALLQDRPELALAMMDNLAVTGGPQAWVFRLGQVDVMLEAGRTALASAALASMLADPQIPPAARDRVLARARSLMTVSRLHSLLEQALRFSDSDPLLLWYKASLQLDTGDPSAAATLTALEKAAPDALRTAVLAARAEFLAGNPDSARRRVERWTSRPGPLADTIRAAISRPVQLRND